VLVRYLVLVKPVLPIGEESGRAPEPFLTWCRNKNCNVMAAKGNNSCGLHNQWPGEKYCFE
jgi:hypothetical protein